MKKEDFILLLFFWRGGELQWAMILVLDDDAIILLRMITRLMMVMPWRIWWQMQNMPGQTVNLVFKNYWMILFYSTKRLISQDPNIQSTEAPLCTLSNHTLFGIKINATSMAFCDQTKTWNLNMRASQRMSFLIKITMCSGLILICKHVT